MRRCMLTATPLSKALWIPIEVKGDIFEHGGCFDGSKVVDGQVAGCTGLTKAELEGEFPGCVVPKELAAGWWTEEQGCETVAQAQERITKVAAWLWSVAEGWQAADGALCIVVHGMFIDILTKLLIGIPPTTGKQQAVFCSKNAGVHILELKASSDGNIAGLQRFNVLHHLPEALQTGGSVAGMDECYMEEGAA
jgi:broad specificity phosphatase PhoE